MSLCLSLIILIVLENVVRVSVWEGQKKMSFLFPSFIQYRKEHRDIMNPSATETLQQFSLNKCAQPTSLFDYSNIPKDGSCGSKAAHAQWNRVVI